ncbi:transcriptional regulator GlxA family with amidase domain [Marmoricola sp. OAE513]|uniref:GlxA family transcriptional regulator n=1 Tax=Marmoricola sp. OAE513 TaxID=2817894 RepID=UPI001AE46FDA
MVDLTVVVLEGAYPSSVAITLDLLGAAAHLAPRLGVATPTWRVCSVDGGQVELTGGTSVATTRLPRRSESSAWVVPGLGTDTLPAVRERLARPDARAAAAGLARHARAGGTVAASCSAVFLLGQAGLLEGRRVTTTWWLAPFLATDVPTCTVDADRMVCTDGNLITGGAALAQTDLMLTVLRRRYGTELTDAVARALLVDARQAQSPYVVPELLANGDEVVARVIAAVEAGLPDPPGVAALASGLSMSERTLARHVTRATGRSTLALIQAVKVRRARALLETSRLSVEQVALAVGYADPTALRRAMKKAVGATPSSYRAG